MKMNSHEAQEPIDCERFLSVCPEFILFKRIEEKRLLLGNPNSAIIAVPSCCKRHKKTT